jgi:hypothetical protein
MMLQILIEFAVFFLNVCFSVSWMSLKKGRARHHFCMSECRSPVAVNEHRYKSAEKLVCTLFSAALLASRLGHSLRHSTSKKFLL